jgi:hypothetical protein
MKRRAIAALQRMRSNPLQRGAARSKIARASAVGSTCRDAVRHLGPACAQRLGRARRSVMSRLVLHLGIELGSQQDHVAEIQSQVMKPLAAPSEP